MRGDRVKLQELVNGLTVAAQRAEFGIAGLKEASDDHGQLLAKKIEDARSLRDDLTYLLERGTGIADRLEGTIRAKRETPHPEIAERKAAPKAEAPQRAEPRLAAPAAAAKGTLAPSRAERDLLRAIAGRS